MAKEIEDSKFSRMIVNAVCLTVHSTSSIYSMLALRGDALKDPRIYNVQKHQFLFVTIWNVILQITYLLVNTICLAQEVYNINDRGLLKPVKAFKQVFFDGAIFTFAFMIVFLYWPLFIYNREWVYPMFIDETIGALPNYIMHAFILPVMLLEFRYMPKKVTSERYCLGFVSFFVVTYLSVLFYNYYATSLWPYPMLHNLDGTVYIYIVFTLCVILSYACYYLQFPLRTLLSNLTDTSKKIS